MTILPPRGAVAATLDGWAGRHGGNAVGAFIIVVSSLTMAMMMAAVKELATVYPVWQIVFFRMAGSVIVFTPLIVRSGGAILRTNRLTLHVVRVAGAFAGLSCWFYSMAWLPLAEASALSFSKSLFLMALVGVILGERPGVIGWIAALLGFVGIVIMLDPSGDRLNQAALIAVLGAAAGAVSSLAIKKMTTTESTATMMAYPTVGITALCVVPCILTWQPLELWALPLFALAGAAGLINQWAYITANRYAEASVLATVEYARLIAAALTGFLLFSEIPTWQAAAGAILIAAASWVQVRRERIRAGIFS